MGVLLHVHGTGAQATHGCTWDPDGDRSGVPTDWLAGMPQGTFAEEAL